MMDALLSMPPSFWDEFLNVTDVPMMAPPKTPTDCRQGTVTATDVVLFDVFLLTSRIALLWGEGPPETCENLRLSKKCSLDIHMYISTQTSASTACAAGSCTQCLRVAHHRARAVDSVSAAPHAVHRILPC